MATKPVAKKLAGRSAVAPTVTADDVVAWLRKQGTKKTRDAMPRYALPAEKAFGVAVGVMRKEAKRIGRNHELALALWQHDWYEARMMAAFLGEPEKLTSAQMDRWCKDFDNWGITDTVCFHLFDLSPLAWEKVPKWAGKKDEWVRRAGFALLASLGAHDKASPDARFIAALPLIEKAATDDRNFVRKGVSWALRSIGRRRPGVKAAAAKLAKKLAASEDAAARTTGKEAVRQFGKSS